MEKTKRRRFAKDSYQPDEKGYIKCSVEGCNRHASYHKRYCNRHYTQRRIYGRTFRSRYDNNKVIYYNDYAEIVMENHKGEEVARAKVSLDRVPALLKYKWSLKDSRYARARDPIRQENIIMGRLILGVLDSDQEVSYRNNDTLDNRDENLVIASRCEIARKMKINTRNTSGYKGVSKVSNSNKWRAYINVGNKQIYLGCFDHIQDAVAARKRGESTYHPSSITKA